MTLDARSRLLFGRATALRVFAWIAGRRSDDFTTGEIVHETDISSPDVSRELKRLVELGLVEPTSMRGNYRRIKNPAFWKLTRQLAAQWASQ